MTITAAEAILNDVLIALHRSLLQYVSAAWAWGDARSEPLRQTVQQLAVDQNDTVDRLADLLRDRAWPVSLGQFPDFSPLNYVSLDYLLKKIVGNQKAVVAECEAASRDLAGDAENGPLAEKIAISEGERLKLLQQLAAAPGA